MKSLIAFLTVLFTVLLVGCSGGDKPSTSELKTALIQNLPGHMGIKSFSVKASQNFGNKVEPNYGSRFQATVTTMVELYKTAKKDKGVTFVRLITEKGKQTDIFGKIISKLYQGVWKHNIKIDGTPIRNLGAPLNQISANRVIVLGSDEEKNYYSEIERKLKERRIERERKAAELRKNITNAKNILVGTWREKDWVFIYGADGTLHWKFDNGHEAIYAWRVKEDMIYYTGKKKKSKYKNSKWKPSDNTFKGKILYIDKNRYTIKLPRVTWKLKRIK